MPDKNLYDYEFDQYQRYIFLQQVLGCVYGKNGTHGNIASPRLLDVGSGPQPLTMSFLGERYQIVRSDVQRFEDSSILLLIPGKPLDMPDNSFDSVLSLEVLEHVPKDQRGLFLSECVRIAKHLTIFSCPNGDPKVVAAENSVSDTYRFMSDQEHPFLVEHADCGLPTENEIVSQLKTLELPFLVYDNVRVDLWEMFFVLDLVLSTLPDGLKLIKQAHQMANQNMKANLAGGVHYRKYYIVAKDKAIFSLLEKLHEQINESAMDRDYQNPLYQLGKMTAGLLAANLKNTNLVNFHKVTTSIFFKGKKSPIAWVREVFFKLFYDAVPFHIVDTKGFYKLGEEPLVLWLGGGEESSLILNFNGQLAPGRYVIAYRSMASEPLEFPLTWSQGSGARLKAGAKVRDRFAKIDIPAPATQFTLSLSTPADFVGLGNLRIRRKVEQGALVSALDKLARKLKIPNFFSALFRRKISLQLRPFTEAESVPDKPGVWRLKGPAPQFLLEGVLPQGWVKVLRPRTEVGFKLARLFFDRGVGFKIEYSVAFDLQELGTKPVFINLGPDFRKAKLALLDAKDECRVSEIGLRQISKGEIALTIVVNKFKEHYRRGTLKFFLMKVMKLVLSGNSKEVKSRLRNHFRSFEVSDPDRYKLWLERHPLPDDYQKQVEKQIAALNYRPKFSILIPVYNIDEKWLSMCLESVLNQYYPNLEVCLADDASTKKHVREVLERYQSKDKRVKVLFRPQNGNISEATNSALGAATGDYICLMDHDDEIPPHALYEFAKLLNEDPDIDMIYSDEDKIASSGERYEPFFKPDWSPETLESCMFTAHFACYRTSIAKEIGGMRKGYEGAQDYDFVLRFTEKTRKVKHVPQILYHWRAIPGSTALHMGQKNYVLDSAIRGLTDRVARSGAQATVESAPYAGCFNIRYKVAGNPLVSIVIPSAGRDAQVRGKKIDLLVNCVKSISTKSTYKNREIIVVDNDDLRESTREQISGKVKKLVHFKEEFNVAKKMNLGAGQASGEYLLFLNDDIEVITPDWLEGLLGVGQQKNVGIVGAKLHFEDDSIQHGGVTFSGSLPDHVLRGYPCDYPGYFFSLCGNRNYMAVTGACLLIKKDLFEQVKGFNEDFPINYNDIDLCLKVFSSGHRIVYTPLARLYHFESQNRERTVGQKEIDLFLKLWGEMTKIDPYYNQNLDQYPPNFKIKI